MTHEIFLIAGEHSGDLHGASLIQALKAQIPSLLITGVGGPKMRESGQKCDLLMEEFEVMGFSEILKSLPKIYRQFQFLKNILFKRKPEVIVLIDYPGFNLRLAKLLRKKGYQGKIVQFISPTVWAWGKSRIQQMEKTLDLLLVIFPFELDYFKNTSLKVQYVGHPLVERLENHSYQSLNFTPNENLLAIFPGSRKKEVLDNLEKQLQVASLLKMIKPSLQIGISSARVEYTPFIEKALKNLFTMGKDAFIVPSQYGYELMRASRIALAKSGTVTLELCLHKTPTVVVYEVSSFNRFIATYILRIKLKFFCIVNILANREVFPEFIENRYTPSSLIETLKSIDQEGDLRRTCLEGCSEVQELLQEKRASERAALSILELLK